MFPMFWRVSPLVTSAESASADFEDKKACT